MTNNLKNKTNNNEYNRNAKGRYVFSWGGGGRRAGASEGRVISESEHQRVRAIPSFSAIQGEGHTFSRIFNEDFCDVIFHFSLTD